MERCKSCKGSGVWRNVTVGGRSDLVDVPCFFCTGTGMVGTSLDLIDQDEIAKRKKIEDAVDRAHDNYKP